MKTLTLHVEVVDLPFPYFRCVDSDYDGAPDSDSPIGTGQSIEEAIKDYLEHRLATEQSS